MICDFALREHHAEGASVDLTLHIRRVKVECCAGFIGDAFPHAQRRATDLHA